jgi:hypothetical protein
MWGLARESDQTVGMLAPLEIGRVDGRPIYVRPCRRQSLAWPGVPASLAAGRREAHGARTPVGGRPRRSPTYAAVVLRLNESGLAFKDPADSPSGGKRLGPVGARIVAEVVLGLLRADPKAWVNVDPARWPTIPAATGARRSRALGPRQVRPGVGGPAGGPAPACHPTCMR